MSWLDGMIEDNEALSQDQRLDRTTDKLAPGVFTGALSTIGPNLLRGAIEGGRTIQSSALQLGSLAVESDLSIGSSYAPDDGQLADQQQFRETQARDIGEKTAKSVMSLRPDPSEVGLVGQILGEASAVLPRTIAGAVVAGPAGAALAAGGPAGFSSKQVGMAEGLDESTATKKGLIDAATTGIGVALPAARFVKPILGDAAIAVGANVGLGMAGRGATAALLESNGYHSQAAQYKALDGNALVADAVMGLAFFGLGRVSFRRPTSNQIDAALTERNAQHADVDTAPGAPIDAPSAVAHQDALSAAVEAINRGEPVVLPDNILSASFLRTADDVPVVAPSRDAALVSAREELLPTIRAETEKAAAGTMPNVKDVKSELSAVSRSIEGLDDTFRARAKEFQGEGMGRKQAEQAARQAIADERAQLGERQSVLNESLNSNRSAEQARADLNALDRGEIPARFAERFNVRADEIIQGFQRKPLAAGVAEARLTPTPRQVNERVAREEIDTLVREHEATLPREPEAAPTPRTEPRPSGKPADPSSATPDRSGPDVANSAAKPAGDGKPATEISPELELLRGAVAKNPEAVVRTGYDADGNPTSARADQVLAEIEAEHAAGIREANSYAAAVGCLLGL